MAQRFDPSGKKARITTPLLLTLSVVAALIATAALYTGLRQRDPESVGDRPIVLAETQSAMTPPPPTAGQTPPPADALPLVDAQPTSTTGASEATQPTATQAPVPTHVRIERAAVDAPVIPLGKTESGALEVPTDVTETGWWTGGPEPGERGPAVIVGHVDSWQGPGVFAALHDLQPGDQVFVDREDGSTVRFRVQRIERHAKDRFPTDRVYGPTPEATLRLITCGGGFDQTNRRYLDNIIVFADLI